MIIYNKYNKEDRGR